MWTINGIGTKLCGKKKASDAYKKRIQQNMELYQKRQAIVEHPFGIIKRQWDFYYIMTKKSMKHASADVGLIFTCYNLRRIMNLVDKNQFKKFLKELATCFFTLLSYFKWFKRIHFFRNNAHFILNNLPQVA